ncbi:MAG: hypothetical protein Q8O33_05925 [Pseudomonadota bacterium]|nr:hypothetical protein [Pseudomonadota bacterium]
MKTPAFPTYAKLADIPFPVDLVNVFREAAGLTVVMDRCIWKDYMRYMP